MLWEYATPDWWMFRRNKKALLLSSQRFLCIWSLLCAKQKTPVIADWGFLGCKSLTMTYFHTGTRTIIGAESFHCPVRDGKEWDQLAMVIRHNW